MSSPPPDLSPGDYAFLGMLDLGHETAYSIKKAMAGSVSFFWSAAHSQVYQQASRLVRDGYVREKAERDGRRRKLLSLTPKGRRALDRWLTAPAARAELRDEMLVKTFFAATAARPGQTVDMLEDQREQYRDALAEFEEIERNLGLAVEHHPHARYQRATVRLGIEVTRAYLSWLDDTIEEVGRNG